MSILKSLATVLFFIPLIILADHTLPDEDDLNVPAAREKYERQRAEADRAKSLFLIDEGNFRIAEDTFYEAVGVVRSIQKSLSDEFAELSKINHRIDEYRRLIVELERNLPRLREQERHFVEGLRRLEDEVVEQREVLQRFRDNLRTAQSELTSAKADIQPILDRISSLEASLSLLDSQISSTSSKISSTQSEISSKNAEINKLEKTITENKSTLNNLNSFIAQGEAEIRNLEGELRVLDNRIENTKNQIESIGPQIKAIHDEIEAEKKKPNPDKTKIESLKKKKQDLQDQKKDLEKELANLKREKNSTEARIKMTEKKLADLRQALTKLPPKIAADEERVRTLKSEVASALSRLQTLQSQLSSLQSQKSGVLSELAQIKAASAPKLSRIAELEAKVNSFATQVATQEALVRKCEREVADARRQLESLRVEIISDERRLADLRRELPILVRQAEECSQEIAHLEDRLRISERRAHLAQSDMENARARMEFSRTQMQNQEALALAAYHYLQQVIANYERERDRILQMASLTGDRDGGSEGDERAISLGLEAGALGASEVGDRVGSEDARRRDSIRGYREGRQNASLMAALSASYQSGISRGKDRALESALKEDFPRGFNLALSELLGGAPGRKETVDISTLISDDPGGNGVEIDPRTKAVVILPAPSFGIPADPPYQLPSSGSPDFSVPARDNRYYSAPCRGLALPEFGPLCENRYDERYSSSYRQGFSTRFLRAYSEGFNAHIKTYYDRALAVSYPEMFEQGRQAGASDQGVLDGFSGAIGEFKALQFDLGKKSVAPLLKLGHLVVIRAADLKSESLLLIPGERVKLSLLVDNFGALASPRLKLRVRVTEVKGISDLSAEVRELPALSGDTRTELLGVLTGVISNLPLGEKIKIAGVVESQSSTSYKEVGRFEVEKEIHYPLELEEILISGRPKVGQFTAASLRLRNKTGAKLDPVKSSLTSEPNIVEVDPSSFSVPELAPEEVAEILVRVKPGVWVGENTKVKFLAKTNNILGLESVTQPFSKQISVDRAGALLLFSENGTPLTDSTLVVTAGGRARIKVQFKFFATTSLPGPFIVRKTRVSHPEITNTSNTTISVNYGSWSPGSSTSPILMSYDVPLSLKGKKGWVMIELVEGNSPIHAAQVNLDIR